MRRAWTRRDLLRAAGIGLGAGATSALLPLMPRALMPSAAAQESHPLRLVLFTTGNGTILNEWRPTGGERDFTLSRILAPLERHRDRLLVLDGVDNDSGLSNDGTSLLRDPEINSISHHAHATLFTGRNLTHGPYISGSNLSLGQGPSVDHVIAEVIGSATLRPSVHVGMGLIGRMGDDPRTRAFYRGADTPQTLITSPRALFEHLFAGVNASTSESEARDRRRVERLSVLDTLRGEFARVQRQLPASERALLDEHLSGVRDLERRVAEASAAACAVPAVPGPEFDPRIPETADVPGFMDLQFDLIASALRCDVTRVVGVQYGCEGGYEVPSWIPSWGSASHHTQGHDSTPESREMLTDASTWSADKFSYFLDQLSATPEGAGSLMDNTVAVWAMPITEGFTHANRNVPIVIAAGRNTPFSTGRVVRWGDYFRGPDGTMMSGGGSRKLYKGGVSINQLLVTLCHAFGLESVEAFGDRPAGSLDDALLA